MLLYIIILGILCGVVISIKVRKLNKLLQERQKLLDEMHEILEDLKR